MVSSYKASVPNLSSSLDLPPKPFLFCQQAVGGVDTSCTRCGRGLGGAVVGGSPNPGG